MCSYLARPGQAGRGDSHEVYESISNQVVSEILIIVAKDRAGVVTEADRERLIKLDELRKVLDSYAAAHNLYVAALQTWEATDQAPTDTIRLEGQMRELIYRGINLAWELGLRVPPTLS